MSFDNLSLKELLEIEAKIAIAKVKAKANEITVFKQECEAMAAKRGVDIADIFGKIGRTKPPVPAKYQDRPRAAYRDPQSGKTWTGFGRAPFWIVGKDRAKFATR